MFWSTNLHAVMLQTVIDLCMAGIYGDSCTVSFSWQ